MLRAATGTIRGREVDARYCVVFGEAAFEDSAASFRDAVGVRSGICEREPADACNTAMTALAAQAMDADAILGIDIDGEVPGSDGGMPMVGASGTVVCLKPAATSCPWTASGGR